MTRVYFTVFLLICLICATATANSGDAGDYAKSNATGTATQKDAIGKAYYGGGYHQQPPVAYSGYSNEASYGALPVHANGYGNAPYLAPPAPTYDAYGGGYNVHDKHGSPPYYLQAPQQHLNSQSSYPPYGPSYHKNYQHDTHYCSVHGSFALAYTQKDNGSGDNGISANEHSKSYYKPRVYTRQYCRYSASASERACQFCCRVVARSSNTSPVKNKRLQDDVVSAIFAFDPLNPSAHSAGYGNHENDMKNDQKDGYGKKLFQCVCCAPKDNSGY